MTKAKKVKQEVEKYSTKTLEEAVKKAQELSLARKRKFVESVDFAINLGIDAKQSDQSVKGSVLLPHGSGKKVKVVVFAANEDQKKLLLKRALSLLVLKIWLLKLKVDF